MEFPEKKPRQPEPEMEWGDPREPADQVMGWSKPPPILYMGNGGPWEKYDEIVALIKWAEWAKQRLEAYVNGEIALTLRVSQQEEKIRLRDAALQGYEVREKLRQSKSVQTLELGQQVQFVDLNCETKARIFAIHIDKSGVRYDVVYWGGSERKVARVSPEEIEVVDDILPHRQGDGPSSITEKMKGEIDVTAFMKPKEK